MACQTNHPTVLTQGTNGQIILLWTDYVKTLLFGEDSNTVKNGRKDELSFRANKGIIGRIEDQIKDRRRSMGL